MLCYDAVCPLGYTPDTWHASCLVIKHFRQELHPRQMGSKVILLHYNDVYNIESRNTEPVRGAASFKTAADQYATLHPLTVFCGDVFSPSVMSTLTRGRF